MIKNDLQEMDYSELVYKYIVARLIIYKLTLDKVTLENERTRQGYLSTTFTFHTFSPNGKPHTDNVRVYDEQYKALLELVQREYPSVEIVDFRQIKE